MKNEKYRVFEENYKKNRDEYHKKYIERYGQKVFDDATKASDFSFKHRSALEKDKKCGCYYCLKIFSPSEIKEWVEISNTALCPYCGIDSVIGESSGYPIDKEFLLKIYKLEFVAFDSKGNIANNPLENADQC